MSRVDYYYSPDAPQANSITIAVSAFVLDDGGNLLMIRRTDNDLYALPGGKLELGETLSEAVAREVEEETGIRVEATELIGTYSNPNHLIAYDDGEVRQEFSICFRDTPVGGSLRTSSETTEVHWTPRDHIDVLNVHPSIQLRIGHGFENRSTAFFQ